MAAINHIGFIVAAYGVAVIVAAALIAWVVLDYRALRRALAELERRGISRRSAAGSGRSEPAMEEAREEA
jgi:heme exporter protein D